MIQRRRGAACSSLPGVKRFEFVLGNRPERAIAETLAAGCSMTPHCGQEILVVLPARFATRLRPSFHIGFRELIERDDGRVCRRSCFGSRFGVTLLTRQTVSGAFERAGEDALPDCVGGILRVGLALEVPPELRIERESIALATSSGFVREVPGASAFRPRPPAVMTDFPNAVAVRAW